MVVEKTCAWLVPCVFLAALLCSTIQIVQVQYPFLPALHKTVHASVSLVRCHIQHCSAEAYSSEPRWPRCSPAHLFMQCMEGLPHRQVHVQHHHLA